MGVICHCVHMGRTIFPGFCFRICRTNQKIAPCCTRAHLSFGGDMFLDAGNMCCWPPAFLFGQFEALWPSW